MSRRIDARVAKEFEEDVYNDAALCILEGHGGDSDDVVDVIRTAIARVVQNTARLLTSRREVSETVVFSGDKDGDKEVSRFDMMQGSDSAEDVMIACDEGACDLRHALELAESARYTDNWDWFLVLFVHQGALLGLWSIESVKGTLRPHGYTSPKNTRLDSRLQRVARELAPVSPYELVDVMEEYIQRSSSVFDALGFDPDEYR
jgi:hypothetical protein